MFLEVQIKKQKKPAVPECRLLCAAAALPSHVHGRLHRCCFLQQPILLINDLHVCVHQRHKCTCFYEHAQ